MALHHYHYTTTIRPPSDGQWDIMDPPGPPAPTSNGESQSSRDKKWDKPSAGQRQAIAECEQVAIDCEAMFRVNNEAVGDGTSNQNMDESKPPARRIDALAGPSLNAEDQNMIPDSLSEINGSHAPELSEKMSFPPTFCNTANNFQQPSTRGSRRDRTNSPVFDFPASDGVDVPLRFVHVPNSTRKNANKALERAPSVPDLISYAHHHHHEEKCSIPLLSAKTLCDKEFGRKEKDRKELLEERLCLLTSGHLRLNWNATVPSAARYRSKSTPSRGGMWASESQRESGKVTSAASNRQTTGHTTSLLQANLRHFETRENNGFRDSGEVPAYGSGFSNAPTPVLTNDQRGLKGPSDINFPEKNSDASSHRIGTLSVISLEEGRGLEPPPPPPPTTEKERLVERERQARLEAERARRRHLALQRERQLENEDCSLDRDSGRLVENESSDNIGQESFGRGLEPAPEYVGDSALVTEMTIEHYSVDSPMANIPQPPLPPPPATEKERLVERERQARLETERARRRHLALQRERRLDIENNLSVNDHDGTIHHDVYINNSPLPQDSLDHAVLATLPHAMEEDTDNAHIEQNTDTAEANSLSYPMERFLERVDVESSMILPIDPSAAENMESELPYTMELFLAEHPVVGTTNENQNSSGDEILVAGGDDAGQTLQPNNDGCIEPLVATSAIQPILASGTNLHEIPLAEVGAAQQGGREADPHNYKRDESEASIIESHLGTLDDNEITQIARRNSSHSWTSTDSSQSCISIASSSHEESFDISPRPSRLTEADIAQLAEVEHASTGNAAPQSIRDEPSEPSVVGRGASLDHAFSVATQTTVIESVTEASAGQGESAFSDIVGHAESSNVIQVDSGESLHTSTTTSRGVGSASIEALPSSVGNALPHSVLGERQFGIATPITEITSVVDPCQHSDNSIEVMPSEHGGDDSDEETIVYQSSGMGSSASVEALPSIDPENEIILHHNYGAIISEDVQQNPPEEDLAVNYDECNPDVETGPLICDSHRVDSSENTDFVTKLRIYIAFGIGFGIGFGIALGVPCVYHLFID